MESCLSPLYLAVGEFFENRPWKNKRIALRYIFGNLPVTSLACRRRNILKNRRWKHLRIALKNIFGILPVTSTFHQSRQFFLKNRPWKKHEKSSQEHFWNFTRHLFILPEVKVLKSRLSKCYLNVFICLKIKN